ncbi:MAG: hypothetical protein C4527_18530 [Candidatus Omnitrophota bacterium]|jgi:uncharacterized membrane protein|nr:MAG: hypothetical protein C4527_18530 [Candidatus Omnitrophota bacterium]
MKQYAQEKKWGEFGIEAGVFLFIWLVSVIVYLLIVGPLLYRMIGALTLLLEAMGVFDWFH